MKFMFIITLIVYVADLYSYDMMLHRTMTAQQTMVHVKTAIAQAVQQQAKHRTMHTFGDYHYVSARAKADTYSLPATKQREYDRVITAPPQQAAEQAQAAGQVASHVVANAKPVAYRSQEFPIIEHEQFKAKQHGDQHIAYGSIPYHQMDVESLHMRAMQMQTWKQYVAQTRTSPQAHAFVAQINKLFAEFNQCFNQVVSLGDYQVAYGVLLEIEAVIHHIEQIKPLSYTLAYDIYYAVKHMQAPFLDLFLGNKQSLTKGDMSQIAWALHGYYKKMAYIFDKKPVAFPSGKLKQAIDTYKNSSPFSKVCQSVSHYMVKGYRDLTVVQKQQQYHQLLKQQQQFLEHTCGIQIDGLPRAWQDRYVARQRSSNQALTDKSFCTRTYILQKTTQAQLKALGLDPSVFIQLRGNALQHTLQTELVKIVNMAAGNKHALAESVLNFAHTGALCNQAGRMQEAWSIADISWAIADHIKAIGEGAWAGTVGAWSAIRHPVTFTQHLATNIGTACYELLSYRWYCLSVEGRLIGGDEQTIIEAALLDLHSKQIKESITNALVDCSTRELLKQGTKACVDYKLTSKLFQSFGKLLAGVKPHLAKPLLPVTHPVKAQLPRAVYEATFDPATKAYVVESMKRVCTSAQEFKRIAPVEFATKTIDQMGKGAALVPKDAVKATLDTNKLAAFKSGIQEAAKRITQPKPEMVDVLSDKVVDFKKVASALKKDAHHAFSEIVDNYITEAREFELIGGDGVKRVLFQVEGSLEGVNGIFEWIVEPESKLITHRLFIKGGQVTGRPNVWAK